MNTKLINFLADRQPIGRSKQFQTSYLLSLSELEDLVNSLASAESLGRIGVNHESY